VPVVLVWIAACRSEEPLPPGPDRSLGAEALYEATYALTSLGARQVATPQEVAARDLVAQAFREAGLSDVAMEPFVYEAWRPGSASLQSDREVPVEALSPSPVTDVELVLRDSSGDFAGAALVLSSIEAPSRTDAYLRAQLGGAAALIRVTDVVDHDGAPLVEVGHLLDGSALPAVAVDQGTGRWLLDRLGSPVRVRIAPEIVAGHTSHNVVGRIAGSGPGTVYVVAHYDSWHPSESAFDNALGVGGLVELARKAVSAGTPAREIVFLATSAEEQGLKGAFAWAEEHHAEIDASDYVLVLDVMWSGEGQYIALGTDTALRQEAIAAAEREGLVAIEGGEPGLGSDHLPFVTRGASAVWLGRWPDRHYHTVADTLDQLDMEQASAALRTNWRLLADHAGLQP
jgi:Zn-dependent M28 family amino/carboxypeptidase